MAKLLLAILFPFLFQNVFSQDLPWFMYSAEFRKWALASGVKEVNEVLEYEHERVDEHWVIDWKKNAWVPRSELHMGRESKNYHIDQQGFVKAVSHSFSEVLLHGNDFSPEYDLGYQLLRKEGAQDSVIIAFRNANCKDYTNLYCLNGPFDLIPHTLAIDTSGVVFVDMRSFHLNPEATTPYNDSARFLTYEYRLEQITDYEHNQVSGIRTFFYRGDFWVVDNRNYGFVPINDSVSVFKCNYPPILPKYVADIHFMDTLNLSRLSKISRQTSFTRIEDLALKLYADSVGAIFNMALSALRGKEIDGNYHSELLICQNGEWPSGHLRGQFVRIVVHQPEALETYYIVITPSYFFGPWEGDLFSPFQTGLGETFNIMRINHQMFDRYTAGHGSTNFLLFKTTKAFRNETLVSETVDYFSFENKTWNPWFKSSTDKAGATTKLEIIDQPKKSMPELCAAYCQFAPDAFSLGFFLKPGKYKMNFDVNLVDYTLINEKSDTVLYLGHQILQYGESDYQIER